jgi:hypothetical protein
MVRLADRIQRTVEQSVTRPRGPSHWLVLHSLVARHRIFTSA